MPSDLQSVIVSKSSSGAWEAMHVPSGRKTEGDTPEEANEAMKLLLGMTSEGKFAEPATSGQFDGLAKAIASFLEGPISETLSFHAGWARLIAFQDRMATIRLGGGCSGCPSSKITLFQGVKAQLQSRFGEDVIEEVIASDDGF